MGGSGGSGGNGANAGVAGAGVLFSAGGMLTNSGTISGGSDGATSVTFTGAPGTFINQSGGVVNGGVAMGNFANSVTLQTGSAINGALNVGASAGSTLTLGGAGSESYSSAVTGVTTFAGSLTVAGGAWTLNQAFNYTGSTTVSAGSVVVGFGPVTSNILPSASPLTLGGGALTLSGAGTQTVNGLTTVAGTNSGIVVGANETLTLGGLTFAGAGSFLNFNLAAGGANAATATLGTGIVVLTGQIAGAVINPGFTVTDAGGFGLATVSSSNDVIRLAGESLLPASGAVSTTTYLINNNGAGTAAAGSSTLTLSVSQSVASLTVDTSAGSGVLTLNSGVVLSNNFWSFGGNGTNTYQITGSASGAGLTSATTGGAMTFNNYNSGAITIASPILANGMNAVAFDGGGLTILASANTYTGATTVTAGTLQLGNGGTTGSLSPSSAITDNATLAFNRSNTVTQGTDFGVIGGGCQVVQQGSGVLILNSGNTYSGGATVSAGTLAVGVSSTTSGSGAGMTITHGATGTGPLTVNGGTVDLGAFNLAVGGLSGSSGMIASSSTGSAGSLTIVINGEQAYAGSIANTTGSGNQTVSVTVAGIGTQVLTGANLYTGPTTIASGTLQLGNAGSAGSLSPGSVITDNASLAFNRSNTVTQGTDFANVIGGGGQVIQQGSGALILLGANTYTGATTISAGTLQLGNGGATGSLSTGSVITDNGALAFNRSNAVTQGTDFAFVIGGAGQVIQQGGGTLVLNGANTYTGGTTLSGGTLAIGVSSTISGSGASMTIANGATGFGLLTVSGGVVDLGAFNLAVGGLIGSGGTIASSSTSGEGSLTIVTSGAQSYSGAIANTTGSGNQTVSVTIAGSGTQILSGANAYTGATVISSGTLQLGANGTTGSLSTGSAITDDGTLAFNRINTVTEGTDFAGVIGGSGGIVQQGSGTLVLNTVNTYTGATTITAGALSLTGSLTGGGAVSTTGSGVLSESTAGVIGGGASVTITGTGTSTLAGANSYTGATTIRAGALSLTGSLTGGGAVSTTGSGVLLESAAGVIGGAASVTIAGTGTSTLAGANSYTGATTITAGTLSLTGSLTGGGAVSTTGSGVLSESSAGVIGGASSVTIAGNGTSTLAGANSYTGATTIRAGALSLTGSLTGGGAVSTTGSGVLLESAAGVIGGAASVTIAGTGTSTLAGANSYSGTTTISSGTLQIGFGAVAANILPSSSALTLGGGALMLSGAGTQTMNGLSTVAGTSNGIVIGANETLTLGGLTSAGAGSFLNFDLAAGGANAGTGTVGTAFVVLSGQTAGTVINPQFTVTDAGGFGLATVNPSNDVVRLTAGLTLLPASGAVSTIGYTVNNNAGGSSAAGSSNLALTASASAASILVDTTAGNGVLTLNSGVVLSNNFWSFGGNGTNTYQITGSASGAGLTSVAASGRLAFTNYNSSAVTIASPILANGVNAVSFNGSGVTVLTVASTYTGATTIGGGVLQLGNAGTTGSLSPSSAITDNATLAFNRSNTVTQGTDFASVISGSGQVIQQGSGSLILNGANTYTGGTTISSGTLQIGAGAAAGSVVGNIADNGTLTFDRSDDYTFGGVISGSGGLVQAGYILRFSAAQTYTGPTQVNSGGFLVLPTTVSQGLAASTVVTIASGGYLDLSNQLQTFAGLAGGGAVYSYGSTSSILTLQVAAGQSYTFTGSLGGAYPAFGFSKAGAGTQIFSGANSYTGATTVTSGTLVVDGNSSSSSVFAVSIGGKLSGYGVVSAISGAGSIAPGGEEILTAPSIDPSGGLSFAFDLTQTGAPTYGNAAASGNDLLQLTASTPFAFALTAANTITLNFSGDTLTVGQTYLGGIFTDTAVSSSMVSGATFLYTGTNGAVIQYEGLVSQASAGFATGTISGGDVMEFEVISVPEPESVAFLMLGAGALLGRRRRRASKGRVGDCS